MHERIRGARKALNLTQRAFAEQLGLAQTSLSMLELGHNTITDKTVKLLCVTFSINEQWLRTGEGEMFAASPYMKEFCDILTNLTPETQQYLLLMARELMTIQQTLLGKIDATASKSFGRTKT